MSRAVVTPGNLSSDFILDFTQPNGKVVRLNLNTAHFGRDPLTGVVSVIANLGDPGAKNIADLEDVNLTGLADGVALVYDLSAGVWRPAPSLGAIDLANVADKAVLAYDDATHTWKPKASLGDVDLTGIADQNILIYDLSTHTWKPKASIGDVNLAGISDGMILVYSASGNVWRVADFNAQINMATLGASLVASGPVADAIAQVQSIAVAGVRPVAGGTVACIFLSNITLTGTKTNDGYTTLIGDRVLVAGQTTPAQNGIYVVSASAWARATDMDAPGEFSLASVGVVNGTVGAGTTWYCNSTVTTVGTDPVSFVKTGDVKSLIAGKLNVSAFNTALAAGAVINMGTVSFTGNQYTAPALVSPFDVVTPAAGQTYLMKLPVSGANTAADPTLVLGALTLTLKDSTGTALNAGDMRGSATYVVRLDSSTVARIIGALNKAAVNLGNVDNTSDVNKPVSNPVKAAQQYSSILKAVSSAYSSSGNKYTLTMGDLYPSTYNFNTSSPGVLIAFTPDQTNSTAKPNLVVGAASTVGTRIEAADGSDIQPGDMIAGALYVLELVLPNWRIRSCSQDRLSLAQAKADLAALTAKVTLSTPVLAQQTAAALPARPDGGTVHWQTWADPTLFMRDQDLWFKLPTPGAPPAPPLDGLLWKLVDQRDGATIHLALADVPQDAVPRLTGVNYKVNSGGAPVPLGLVYSGEFSIGGMTDDVLVSIYLQYANYLGSGAWSSARAITPNAGDFFDSFTSDLGAIHQRNNWSNYHLNTITVGSLGAYSAALNSKSVAVLLCPFTADHYAAMNLNWTISTTTKLFYPGLIVRAVEPVDKTQVPAGVQLRASQTDWQLVGIAVGSTTEVILASGALAAFPTTMRLEVSGWTYTAKVNGVTVTTFTDTAHAYPADGQPGLRTFWPGGTGASTTALYMQDFSAGDI